MHTGAGTINSVEGSMEPLAIPFAVNISFSPTSMSVELCEAEAEAASDICKVKMGLASGVARRESIKIVLLAS